MLISEILTEDLRAWFGKGKKGGAGGGGWDRYNTKGERIGKCGDSKKGEGKPKCLSKSKAASLRAKGGKKAMMVPQLVKNVGRIQIKIDVVKPKTSVTLKGSKMNWLVILTLKSILSSIIGSSFYQWFKNTKMGVWFQVKMDNTMEWVAKRYDIEIASREDKWLKQYPRLADRIVSLEKEVAELKKSK